MSFTDIIGIQEPGERYDLDCARKHFGDAFVDAILNSRIDVELEEEDGTYTIRGAPFPEIIEKLKKIGGEYSPLREIWTVPGDSWELGKVFGHGNLGNVSPGYPDSQFDADEWIVVFESDAFGDGEPWNYVCGFCHEYMTEFDVQDYPEAPGYKPPEEDELDDEEGENE